jgi:hypothetical protein
MAREHMSLNKAVYVVLICAGLAYVAFGLPAPTSVLAGEPTSAQAEPDEDRQAERGRQATPRRRDSE